MNTTSGVARVRTRVLQALFELLYTRLGFLHEAIGRLAYGPAWDGRRRHVVPSTISGLLVDIGCGEGRLLGSLAHSKRMMLGIEPSTQMAKRAVRRHVNVVQAAAQAIPLRTGSVQQIVVTYPGPWILDPRTWDEIARVCVPTASVNVLLGGDISRGPGATFRNGLLKIAYGKRAHESSDLPRLGCELLAGDYQFVEDDWGTAIIWRGSRLPSSPCYTRP